MKRICIVIGLMIICQTYNIVAEETNVCGNIDEQVDQSQMSMQCVVYNTFLAQSFRPTLNILTKVELALYIEKAIEPTDITLTIRDRLYGNTLSSITISSDDIPYQINDDCYWGWIEFNFDDIEVIPMKKYYLILSLSEGEYKGFDDTVMWFIGWNNPYPAGGSFASKDFLWLPMRLITTNIGDFSFKTYGY